MTNIQDRFKAALRKTAGEGTEQQKKKVAAEILRTARDLQAEVKDFLEYVSSKEGMFEEEPENFFYAAWSLVEGFPTGEEVGPVPALSAKLEELVRQFGPGWIGA